MLLEEPPSSGRRRRRLRCSRSTPATRTPRSPGGRVAAPALHAHFRRGRRFPGRPGTRARPRCATGAARLRQNALRRWGDTRHRESSLAASYPRASGPWAISAAAQSPGRPRRVSALMAFGHALPGTRARSGLQKDDGVEVASLHLSDTDRQGRTSPTGRFGSTGLGRGSCCEAAWNASPLLVALSLSLAACDGSITNPRSSEGPPTAGRRRRPMTGATSVTTGSIRR